MFKALLAACALLLASTAWAADNPHVLISTNKGDIEVELNADKAPVSTANFLAYVDSGFYKGTLFHRVIPGFMIQGGGYTRDMQEKRTKAPIKNEADNGLKNLRGTLAMARTSDVNSATSQFFINVENNAFLDHGSRDFGYAVFGKVVRGMEVVDQIAGVQTIRQGMLRDIPREPVIILAAKRL
ncbi:peptidylprolyl isomerase [Pseudomonas oryzihabitans]|uniref:peptidylprolyl isomerase n=1 Tax=Pseudomonas rhizoryzae TaxID=2571129 RepID=UPI000735E695|nr:peptidylprolyl isomerase [Pseudomonas rhizoryzae]APQ10763.1 peptidylprolyl isomerase A [Pseudomonas psychrotolerans]KTS78695.1 peptidylprolyl isomerase [Pseudomonas psychrotolerans]KTS97915.1 peptidylprolyl isomerase [Pseudomonas psychrotolerans]KTT27120.1 peptidylprolyl isomerase [Pseudomonas psychrotolerans]KTT33226.1 peptidylprolyl isomerase [Pseudomonas psychrotolerans]